MSFAMQNLITNSQKSFVSLMSQKCTISEISSNSKRSTETIRPKSERSTFRSLHLGTSRHIQSQFTQDLLQASTKAKNLKSAIVKSVCYGLPEEKSLGNHTRHAAKGMPQISLTASDRLTNQILKEDLNKIVRKVRDARKNEVSIQSWHWFSFNYNLLKFRNRLVCQTMKISKALQNFLVIPMTRFSIDQTPSRLFQKRSKYQLRLLPKDYLSQGIKLHYYHKKKSSSKVQKTC